MLQFLPRPNESASNVSDSPTINCLPLLLVKPRGEIEQSSLAGVPFVQDISVYQCSSLGGFCRSIVGDDVILHFPREAVSHDSDPVKVEVGVTLNGPFTFQGNVKPVSPIVWISSCDLTYNKAIKVTLCHFVDCKDDTSDLVFYESVYSHSSNSNNGAGLVDGFHFKPSSRQTMFTAHNSSGTILTTKLNSFMCICYKQPEQIPARTKYCLIKVTPTAPCDTDRVMFLKHFVLTHFLDTCIEVSSLF